MTKERKEFKSAKDKEHYHKKKAENKVKKITVAMKRKKRA